MKSTTILISVLLGVVVHVADRLKNRGFPVGYYGELNKLTSALEALPGVSVDIVGYNPDVTLEEISYQITDSNLQRSISFGQNDPIRDLSGDALAAALAKRLAECRARVGATVPWSKVQRCASST